ncbi:hypothetical protein Pcinc_016272 [Petrolisthes cinctipes]|uniref:Uncharacterized protein n=1 Tax=Petrolisthes cinctipes TaxID=88211 RepID=A0AAE1KPM9_PETCI|nr:hypothetical protein Pcinc_016272 [Petrolisthes cinctipes]
MGRVSKKVLKRREKIAKDRIRLIAGYKEKQTLKNRESNLEVCVTPQSGPLPSPLPSSPPPLQTEGHGTHEVTPQLLDVLQL